MQPPCISNGLDGNFSCSACKTTSCYTIAASRKQIDPNRTHSLLRCGATFGFERLSNEKPSAIFRLRGTHPPATSQDDVTATLGISIEPLESVQAQVASLPQSQASAVLAHAQPTSTSLSDPVVLAERIVTHLFNHLSSFDSSSLGPQTMVPLGLIQRWYDSFLGKLRAGGVGFLGKTD